MDYKVERYTPFLMNILQEEEKLENFLDVIFGFLRLRTDFYHLMTNENTNMGFPPGRAKEILLEHFKKHEHLARQRQPKPLSAQPPQPVAMNKATPAKPQKGVVNPVIPAPSHPASKNNDPPVKPQKGVDNPVIPAPPQTTSSSSPIYTSDNASTSPPSVEATPNSSANIEEDGNTERVYMADSDQYNGATFDSYSWSQSILDLDVRIKVPPEVKSSKQLRITIGRKHIKAVCLFPATSDQPATESVLVDDDLKREVKHTEAIWAFQPRDHQIYINLDKVDECWWDALLVSEHTLNTRHIDCSRPFEELDDEAQAKIRELMYDQELKRQGKSGIQEQKMQDMIKKAMQSEGCPFPGVDPSLVKYDESTGNITFPSP